MNHRFATPTPPRLRIEFRSGSVLVRTDDVEETTVDLRGRRDDDATRHLLAETTIEQRGNEIVVLVPKRSGGLFGRSPELELVVSSPRLTALAVESGSADITGQGDFATSSVQTGAGDVTISHIAGSARVRSGSGDIRVDAIDGDADVTTGSADVHLLAVGGALSVITGSGDVRLGEGGAKLDAKSGSGDISVQVAPEKLSAKTGSGDVSIDSVRRGEITARTASGDIRAGVWAGTAAWLDVRTISGRVSSDLEAAGEPSGDEERVRLRLESVSGDIDLVRVAGDQRVRSS